MSAASSKTFTLQFTEFRKVLSIGPFPTSHKNSEKEKKKKKVVSKNGDFVDSIPP